MSAVSAVSEAVAPPSPRMAALDLSDASATNLRVQPAVSTFAATTDEADDVALDGGDSFAEPTRSEAFADASEAAPPAPILTQTTAMLPGEVTGAVPLRLDVPRGGVEADSVRLAPEHAETAAGLPVPSTIPGDEPAVRAVLQQYGSAYTRLDARAARVVWPSVDGRALARAFEALESQQVVFERCDVFVQGSEARAACRGSATYVPRVGDRRPRTEPRQWTFRLEKAADANWRIASADIRAR